MAVKFSESTVITGDIHYIWATMTDVAAWPEWDTHYEKTGFEGPFEAGAIGWNKPRGTPGDAGAPFTVTAVEDERSFSTDTKMPVGNMLIDNTFEPLPDGRVAIRRDVEVRGGFAPMFRLFFLNGMRKDMQESFLLLEAEAKRRAAAAEAAK
jgi:hypothetical protein